MANREFEFRGINHIALVSSDMARTVAFYRDVLGMPLTKTIEIPGGGQHFFFDCGNGDSVAFFWFPGAPAHAPGIASAGAMPGLGDLRSAHGSMNHLAFNIPAEHFDAYVERLKSRGVAVSPVLNHDDSESTIAPEFNDEVYVRSVYFQDPDGILLEFACWTRPLDPATATALPANADGERVPVPSVDTL
ncbi:MAG: VOC family protein [Actinomycetota bacterium]